MISALVLLAEPDRALRQLMRRAVAAAGYPIAEVSSALQLDASLRAQDIYCSQRLLLLLTSRFALDCAIAIQSMSRIRHTSGMAPPIIQLTRELGELPLLSPPDLGACLRLEPLEKPFDLADLQAITLRCLLLPTQGLALNNDDVLLS